MRGVSSLSEVWYFHSRFTLKLVSGCFVLNDVITLSIILMYCTPNNFDTLALSKKKKLFTVTTIEEFLWVGSKSSSRKLFRNPISYFLFFRSRG